MTQVGVHRRSRSLALAGVRLRFLGIAMVLFLIGGKMSITGFERGFDMSQLLMGLVLLGFGGLWLYARGGIGPNFPAA